VDRADTSSAGVPFEENAAAVVAGAGAQVDDPVGVGHDGLVVLDDDDGLAGVHQAVEEGEEVLDVGEVEAGGGLVEDVDAALAAHVVASLSRCRSPPERVVSGWPSER
jgi:hypothetical protein